MEPFTILCDTCASRLKVKARTAIGQRLACPKCGSMIEVVAPIDWVDEQIGADEKKSLDSAGSGGRDSSETDFEDVDHVLATTADPPDNSTVHRQRRETGSAQPFKTAPPSVADAAKSIGQKPLLPNERWTARATLQRRQWFSLVAAIIGLLVLASAVVLAISANQSSKKIVAESGSNAADAVTEKPELPSADENPPMEAVDALPATSADDVLADDDSMPTGNPPDANPPDSDPIMSDVQPPSGPPNDSGPQRQPTVVVSDVPANVAPWANEPGQLTANSVSQQSGFSELAQVLESSGSSLFEINQLADLSGRRRVGLRKYFVRRPEPIDPRNLKRLDMPVAGVQFSGQTLLQVIAEISLITGVPISFDVDILRDCGFDFGLRIDDLKLTDTSFLAVIEAVLAKQPNQGSPDRFVLLSDGKSPATISTDARDAVEARTFSLPVTVTIDRQHMEQFANLLKSMIAPQSWNEGEGEYSLVVEGLQIQASQKPVVLNQIGTFLEKWNLAKEIQEGTADANALRSRWQASAEKRSAATQSTGRLDVPIEIFLTGLGKQSGVNLLTNWNELIETGWNPTTMIPGDVDEATVADVLDELTHSMDVAWRVVDEDTFEITSAQLVDQTEVLEFYPCGNLLSGPLNAAQLLDLISQSLRSANHNSNHPRYYLDAATQCLIVFGPQSVHRQIEAVISRLEKLE